MSSSPACVDASFVGRLFLGPDDFAFWQLLENWYAEGKTMHAPALLAHELTNVFYRYRRAGYLSSASAKLALDAALGLPITLDDDAQLHRAAMRMAATAATYDAHYLALAERLGAELWTADAKLARHAAGSGVTVNLVGRAGA
jgi:predicted nucleic acid-binding protein